MPTVRPATVEDSEILNSLLEMAIAEVLPARGGDVYLLTEIRKDFSGLADELADKNNCAVVGVYEDAVVGWGFSSIVEINSALKVGRVKELFVQPEARGIGVGEVILSHLVDWAKKMECSGIEGTALPGNRDFKGIFERFEMKTRMLTVYKSF